MKITPVRTVNASVMVTAEAFAKKVIDSNKAQLKKDIDVACGAMSEIFGWTQGMIEDYARVKYWPNVEEDDFHERVVEEGLTDELFDLHAEIGDEFMNNVALVEWATHDTDVIVNKFMTLFAKNTKKIDDICERFLKEEPDSELAKLAAQK